MTRRISVATWINFNYKLHSDRQMSVSSACQAKKEDRRGRRGVQCICYVIKSVNYFVQIAIVVFNRVTTPIVLFKSAREYIMQNGSTFRGLIIACAVHLDVCLACNKIVIAANLTSLLDGNSDWNLLVRLPLPCYLSSSLINFFLFISHSKFKFCVVHKTQKLHWMGSSSSRRRPKLHWPARKYNTKLITRTTQQSSNNSNYELWMFSSTNRVCLCLISETLVDSHQVLRVIW